MPSRPDMKSASARMQAIYKPQLAIVNTYTLIAAVYCAVFTFIFYYIVRDNLLAAVHGFAFIGVVINYLILRRTNNFTRATNIILTIGTSVVTALFATGGWENSGYLWPFGYLPFAIFLTDSEKSARFWVIVLFLTCAGAVALDLLNILTIPYSAIALFNYFGAYVVFTLCIFLFLHAKVNYEEFIKYTQRVFEAVPDAVVIVNEAGEIEDWNQRAENMFGWKKEETVGLKMMELIFPATLNKEYISSIDKLLISGSAKLPSGFIELTAVRKDGSAFTVEIMRSPLKQDKYMIFTCFIRDISARKNSEEKLRRETAYVSLLQMIAVAANEASSFEEAVKFCMKKVCEITDWPLGHLYRVDAGKKTLRSTRHWHMEDESKFELFKKVTEETDFSIGVGLPGRVLETRKPAWIADVSRDRNFPRNITASELGIKSGFAFPILTGNEVGAVLEFFSTELIEKDERLLELVYHLGTQLGRVLERKHTEDVLRASEGLIRSIVRSAYDAFILIDEQGHITDWNPQAELTFGWKIEEVLGRKLSEVIIPPQFRDAHERGLEHFKKTGKGPVLNKRLELSALHREGHEFPVEFTITPVRVNGTFVFAAFLHDISERKQDEQKLKLAKERAEASERVKQLFLANMSHEIRTPMNAIIGFARLLEEADLSPEHREYVNAIKQSGDNLLVIINDILDISKIEAGKIVFEKSKIDLQGMINSTISMFQTRTEAKNVKLSYTVDPAIPAVIIGDAVRLNQILLNLLSNAVKFTKKGEIEVISKLVSDDKKNVRIRFSVSDTGIGIPPEQLDTIFESFTQATVGTTRRFGGTGLGLSIVKQLVELQGGKITVKSEPGKGSVFTFTLEFQRGEQEEGAELSEIKKEKDTPLRHEGGVRILVVEDNPVNQLLAVRVLSKWNFVAEVAENGRIAIEKLEEKEYDLVLMDIQMPEMDGYEATTLIRKKKWAHGTIPIIAMTAHAIKGEREKCLSLGMNDYVSKPFEPKELYTKIIKYVGK